MRAEEIQRKRRQFDRDNREAATIILSRPDLHPAESLLAIWARAVAEKQQPKLFQ